jgi:serine/threonine protein kinase
MHERRVVHRDLKPENLLLKVRDKSKLTPVKLADFGFAKSIIAKNGCRSLCGTPGYLAPEILERFPSYDVQCDIWSVGAILFLLLGGYLPFDDEDEEKVFDRTRNAAYDFNPRCWKSISFGAKELISKCLTIDPRKRFSAVECLNHRWMAKNEVARNAQIEGVQDKLSGQRKMRQAVKALIATNRLQQLNDNFTNYLEKKRQDSTVSCMTSATMGTRYDHARFVEDSPSGKPFDLFYREEELLGEDEYCTVSRCIRNQTQLSYDVKHVHLTNLDMSARKTIQDEITALKLLRGAPHVIRLLDDFQEKNNPGHVYLVFEAMKGGNLLSRIVDKEVYTEREARQVCKTVFTAIDYCHKKKVAHRDIKPQNVFLHEEGDDTSVRVANFGFAKKVMKENSLQTLCGTANYVAPEILNKACQGYDQRCDIWSLGVFTYVLLGGYPPFEGVHDNLADEIMRGQYVFDEEYWSEISDSAKRMISRMLLVDPKERISLSKALACKWMETEEERLVLRDLSTAQNTIRRNQKPVAKVKAAVNAILARNKFLSIAGMFKHNDTQSIVIGNPNPLRDQTIVEVEEKAFRDSYLWGSQVSICLGCYIYSEIFHCIIEGNVFRD